jgi:phosphatidylglycerol lysyltransferase
MPQQASKTLHVATGTVTIIAVIGLCKDVGWIVLVAKRRAPITIRNFSLQLPSLRHTLAQLGIGLLQLSAITGILYAFMPAELNMSWPAFVGVYCIAFVAGQMSNVPAGLGVLEAALLLMLPQVPPAKLLGAVLAYRGVFELLPLIVALLALVWVEGRRKREDSAASPGHAGLGRRAKQSHTESTEITE